MGWNEKFDHVENVLAGMDRELEEIGESLMESTEVEHLMVDFNIDQMKAGKDSNNNDIQPPYKTKTIKAKIAKGQPYDRVTLRDEGDFQNAMKVRNSQSKVEILSEDVKSAKLQEKYSERIFGLNDQHLAMLREFLKPKFQVQLRKYVNS